MEKEYIILADESDKSGPHFSSFYGGVIVAGSHWNEANDRLLAAKSEANITSEVKWAKVSPFDDVGYKILIKEFFNLMAEKKLRMRVMFRENKYVATNLSVDHHKDQYFILYYEFLKHGFGLQHMPKHPNGVRLKFYLDQLPDQSKEKLEQFRGYISGIAQTSKIRDKGLFIEREDITEINSKQHILLQCADVVLGSMPFRLNDKHKQKPTGKRVRGKRTIAKEGLYKYILSEIKRVTQKPNFNIGISTGRNGALNSTWEAPYLHWNFKSRDHIIDRSQTKNAKKCPT